MDEINSLIASDIDLKVANIPVSYKTSVLLNKSANPITKSATPIKVKKIATPIEKIITVNDAPIVS